MPRQCVGDIDLYYDLIDYTEPWKSGRLPVLLLHGLGGDHRLWLYQVAALCGKFPILLVDLRGHGESSPAAADFTIADMARDLIRLLRTLGIERTHLVGLSLGGLVAQQFALDYPFAAASLVLAGAFAALPAEARAMAEEGLRFIEANDMTTVAKTRITNAFSDGADAVMRGYVIDRVAGNDKTAYERAARAGFGFSATERLAEIGAPTLIVIGSEDRVVPPALSETLAARIPGARIARITGAGHISNMESHAEFNRILLEFLQRL